MAETLFDDTYQGKRWTYGLRYRPAGYANIPDGWIISSDKPRTDYPHGSIDYPRELTAEEVEAFQLELIPGPEGGNTEYERAVYQATEAELESHPFYRIYIQMMERVLREANLFASFNVEQTGGFTMVPTFQLNDGRSVGFTWDSEHWLICIYDDEGECVKESPTIPDAELAVRTQLHQLLDLEIEGGDA